MTSNIEVKKSTIYIFLAVIIIGSFLFFAMKNILAGSNDESISGELVQGGVAGANQADNEGDAQIINLGVANYNYDPNTIAVEAGKPVRIIGNMQQLQGCLRALTIPALGIQKVFSQKDNVLEFTPQKKGSFPFSCSMGMGYGTLIVKSKRRSATTP